MDFVIDSNIIMSILIKPKGKIYEVFRKLTGRHSLFISDITLLELNEHHPKLLKLSGLNHTDFEVLKGEVLQHCSIAASKFISEEILFNAWQLVMKHDKNDMAFVATAIYLDALLWSADQKLLTGLRREGFMKIISTKELTAILGGL